MNNTKYAYAVSHIRANEKSLLTNADMEQLIASGSFASALRVLADKGYSNIDDSTSYETALKDKQLEVWELVCDVLPQKGTLDFLVVKNDYHNIKAVLKSTISQRSIEGSVIKPTFVDVEEIQNALQTGDYSALPEYIQEDLKEVYELAVRTNDGQLTDITLDRKANERMKFLADKTEDEFIKSFAEKIIAIANIKIAIRGARTSRDAVFFDSAFCKCDTLDIEELKQICPKGENEVLDYLENTVYTSVVEAVKESNSAFEKWCDDEIMNSVEQGKTENFSVAPIVAYYYAKETEIRNIRIILSCIYNGLSREKITERMRMLYV